MSSHSALPEHAPDSTVPAPEATGPGAAAGPARSSRGRRLGIGAALLALPVLAGGGIATAAAHKSVELDIDGQTRTVATFAGSVEGVLAQQGVEVGEHDLLAPAADEALREGAEIVVRHATQIEVQVDGETRGVWTTAPTTGEALASIGEAGRQVTVAASRSLDGARQALDLPLVADGVVQVTVDGEVLTVDMDGEAYLADVLAQAGITVGKLDHVVVGAASDGTPEVTVTRVAHMLRATTEPVPFATTERPDDTLYVGERRVVQAGQEGVLTRVQAARLVDGTERAGAPADGVVTTAPVEQVVAVGTKERPVAPRPAPAPAPAASGSSGSSGAAAPAPAPAQAAPAPATGDVWGRLAQCESGGNPSIVSANGLYHGLYQFSVATWRAVGGSGLPSQASPAEQTQRAQALQARSGWGQWPACSAKLGLR
ncbi:ubiquitin-like domain-containing protein [Georgenia wangjunii]|uniref:ubiquitin-like domain-containing protein n=1 Tax=Georgenia wangjunii TaxID=3117730 RepID=UPI002F2625DC